MNHSNPETEVGLSQTSVRCATPVEQLKVNLAMIAYRLSELSQWIPRPSFRSLARGAGAITFVGTGYAIENFSGRTALVQAAGCENPILAMTFLFAPNPDKSPNGVVVNSESIVVPIDLPEFGSTELIYKQNFEDLKSPEKIIPIHMDNAGDHGEGKTIVKEECNTTVNGKPGLKLKWRQQNDIKDFCEANGEKPTKDLILANGEPGYTVAGKVVRSATIDSLVKSSKVTELKKVGTVVIDRLAKVFKAKPRFTAPEDKGKEYFEFLKQRANDIKVISEKIQVGEKECSKPPAQNQGSQSTLTKEKLLESIQDQGKREEVRKNIEEKGNPVEYPYRYEVTILGALRRLFNWKW